MDDANFANAASSSDRLVAAEFLSGHGEACRVYRAPGRVNLIGEHTDYNDGFVMPAALGFYTYVAAGARKDQRLCVHSLDYNETLTVGLDGGQKVSPGHWSAYVLGVAAILCSRGLPLRGANLVIKGDVPIGAGLSSSAALEVATAMALLSMSSLELDRREIAAVCQRAEHEYAGTKCGIMDQFIACFGQADHALLLDCRSLDYELLQIPPSLRIVICNSMVKHELAAGEYNLRRADCDAGVKSLQPHLPAARALRDVTLSQLDQWRDEMPERIYRRCRHVIGENERTLDAAAALRSGDLGRFGSLMYASHASLRDDYEVSCPELDLLVDLARPISGVLGARMTGGGFGGCTVNLVEAAAVNFFCAAISGPYQSATGKQPAIYICEAADGAGEVGAPG